MKADKIRELDDQRAGRARSQEMHDQMFRLRFQMAMGQTEGLKKYRGLQKDRARMLTILRERELKAARGKGS